MTRLLSVALLLVIATTASAADKKKPTPGKKKVKVTYEDHVTVTMERSRDGWLIDDMAT